MGKTTNELKQKYPLNNWLPPNSISFQFAVLSLYRQCCPHFTTVLAPLYDSAAPTLQQCCPHFMTILSPLYNSAAPIPPNGSTCTRECDPSDLVWPLYMYKYKHVFGGKLHIQLNGCKLAEGSKQKVHLVELAHFIVLWLYLLQSKICHVSNCWFRLKLQALTFHC